MSIAFNWEVVSVNSTLGQMVVKYTVVDSPDYTKILNMSMPPQGSDLVDHVQRNAPVSDWYRILHNHTYLPVSPGEFGLGTISLPESNDSATVSGELATSRLKALIKQVIDEDKENTV